MSQIEAVFFDCDGTLIDNRVICSRIYITMFREFGVHIDLEEIFTRLKGVRLYEIIDIIGKEQGVTMVWADAEYVYRVRVACLFDTELEDTAGADELLTNINVPVCVISDGSVSKIQHSLGKLNVLYYFPEKLFSGYSIQRWKPDLALIFHAVKAMNVNTENYILIDNFSAGTRSRIGARMEMFYSCAGPHSEPIVYPKVTTSTHLSQLPGL